MTTTMKIGVLAIQGAFREHCEMLSALKIPFREIRLPQELDQVNALIIPGGESTTIYKGLETTGLLEPLKEKLASGMPAWGTCAGMILLAKNTQGDIVSTLNVLDITIERNAYGRQLDSFETDLEIPALGEHPFRAVFIRAPQVESAGPDVKVLASLNGKAVAVQQGAVLATAFHPELTTDSRFHAYFAEVARLSHRHCEPRPRRGVAIS